MTLELNDREARVLDDILHNYLPEVAREASRTDDRALRHTLIERQELVEKLLGMLALTQA